MANIISRIGLTPVGSEKYRVNRLRFHLLAYSIARSAQLRGESAQFIIRCDDTDRIRDNREYLDPYLKVLDSIGVNADKTPYDKDSYGLPLIQSMRGPLYSKYLNELTGKGLTLVDSTGATFFNTEKFANIFVDELDNFRIPAKDVSMGNLALDIRSYSPNHKEGAFVPFPIVRSNGDFLFNFCSPIDDGVLGITHVVRDRGKLNLLANQEAIRIALGFPPINYVHLPLLVDKEKHYFASDDYYGDSTVQDFAMRGVLTRGLVSYLLAGVAGSSEKFYSNIDDFASKLELRKIHKAETVFSPAVLEQHNKKAMGVVSEQDYVENVINYLSWSDPDLNERFRTDAVLLDVVAKSRRHPKDAKNIIDVFRSDDHESLPIESEHAVRKVLSLKPNDAEMQESKPFFNLYVLNGKNNARDLGLSYPDYCKAITYVLTGKIRDISLRDVVRYREETGTIEDRLKDFRIGLSVEGLIRNKGKENL